MVVVADLVARLSTTGAQESQQQIKAVGQEATTTARALEIMAAQYSKLHGGTAASALEMFNRAGVQPTVAAMAEAARSAEKTAAAVTATVAPAKAAAAAAAEHATGWTASESSLVRFGAALVGVNLGISLVAGAARAVRELVVGVVDAQLDWERSLKNLSGLYGEVGQRAAALANAQANLPGVLGTQQQFAQAAINASPLAQRYGLPQRAIDQLTTTGGRLAFSLGMTDSTAQDQLQAQLLAAVQSGAALPPGLGIYVDPESVSRRLGFQGAQSLQAFTPQQVMAARAAIVSGGGNEFADRANANRRLALDTATAAEKALEQARSNSQNALENVGGGFTQRLAEGLLTDPMGAGGLAPALGYRAAASSQMSPGLQAAAQEESLGRLVQAQVAEAQALADSKKAQDDARQSLMALSQTVEGAGARLLSFFGSLESPYSIGHGDILAQAQGAVAARSVGPNILAFQTPGDIQAQARNRAAQDAWQTYVAARGQQEQTDVVQRNLQRLAAQSTNPTPDRNSGAQQTAAQQGLAEETRRGPAALALRNAEQADALAQLRVAEQQSNVEAISLQYRERALNVEKDTIGLRKTEAQISMDNLRTTETLIRAQQSAIGPQGALMNANYQIGRNALVAQERQARIMLGQDVSDLPSFDSLIRKNVSDVLNLSASGTAVRAYDAAHAVDVAGLASAAGGLRAGAAQIPISRASLQLAIDQFGDDPARLAAELGLTGAQGGALGTGVAVRAATVNLNNPSLTVNVNGTVRLADDAIRAAAQAAYDQVEQALREGIAESDQGGVPAAPQLAGARHQ